MTDSTQFWLHAARLPFVPAGRVHRAALEALSAGDHDAADALFEAAAVGYRRTMRVEPIARLRVHQLIGRILAHGIASEGLVIEVEQRLSRLDTIESLQAPFDLVSARSLMATWRDAIDAAPKVSGRHAAAA